MGKKKSSKNKNNNSNKSKTKKNTIDPTGASKTTTTTSSSSILSLTNFVPEAGPGCYICRRDDTPDWLIEWEDVDAYEFIDDDGGHDHAVDLDNSNNSDNRFDDVDIDNDKLGVPDVAIDTDERTLSVCNVSKTTTKVAYVSVYDSVVFGKDGKTQLAQGSTTDNAGQTSTCITFIVLCPPETFCHLVYLQPSSRTQTLTDIRIESDVSPWTVHPCPDDEHPFRIGFPLGRSKPVNIISNGKCESNSDNDYAIRGSDDNTDDCFLCTQGEGGRLTHFFSGNQHAFDFQCPVNTELLAVADGSVVEACDKNTLTGISVSNLFEWNSILLEVYKESHDEAEESSGPLFVEYVHISKSLVQKGDKVKKGQVIGYSGSVGFSPEPHLHFSAFRSTDPQAPTCRVRFQGTDPNIPPFLPIAGQLYNAKGPVANEERQS